MHSQLSERRSFDCIFCSSVPAHTYRCGAIGHAVTDLGSVAFFFCALRHLSQLTAVYLPVEAMERAGSRLINSSVSN